MVQRDRYALEDVILGVLQGQGARIHRTEQAGAVRARICVRTFSSSGVSRARCFARSSRVEISVSLSARDSRTSTATSLSVGFRPCFAHEGLDRLIALDGCAG